MREFTNFWYFKRICKSMNVELSGPANRLHFHMGLHILPWLCVPEAKGLQNLAGLNIGCSSVQ